MGSLNYSLKAIYAIWKRNVQVWIRWFFPSVTGNVFNPILYFFAFGFGLGAVVETMDGVPYISYIVPGMMCYAAMFNAGFETTIGSYSRFKTQRTYDAVLATPVGLHQLLLGEIAWATTKALISATGVLVAAYLFDAIPSSLFHTLQVYPIMFVGAVAFAVFGLLFTSISQSYEFFNYFFTFWVTPNFIFTGAFFPVDRFPEWVQAIAQALPMTHFINISRDIMLPSAVHYSVTSAIIYLAVISVLGYVVAYTKLKKRLFD